MNDVSWCLGAGLWERLNNETVHVTLTKPPMGNVIWKRTIAWISFWYNKTIISYLSCSSFVLGYIRSSDFSFSLCQCYYTVDTGRKNKKKNRGFGREHIIYKACYTWERWQQVWTIPGSFFYSSFILSFMLSSLFFFFFLEKHQTRNRLLSH